MKRPNRCKPKPKTVYFTTACKPALLLITNRTLKYVVTKL